MQDNPTATSTKATTYEDQLAERAGELLPDLNLAERLELLGVMTPDDMCTSLAWLAGYAPAMFDAALVRDRELPGRLQERLGEDGEDGEDEPYCRQCGADVGIFMGHGDAWLHYTGEGTAGDPVELYDAGHAPEAGWRPAGAQ